MFTFENLIVVFYYTAVFSTILYIIKTILFAFTGGDAEVFTDFNAEFETETSFDFLSIQSILAFLMGFGWMGLVCLKQWNLSNKLSLFSAVVFGFVLMFVSTYLMFLVKKLNKKVIRNYSECIGKTAKAYTAFHPNGEGQIEVEINKKLCIENAHNASQEEISAFSAVRITEYKNNTFYIEKI